MLDRLASATAVAVLLCGCANGLTPRQTQEYRSLESRGLLVEEKSPSTAAWLGLLPGCGSFYAREPGYGVLNLLTWPISMLWDPISGQRSATVINYQASVARIHREQLRDEELARRERQDRVIDDEELKARLRAIKEKYAY